MKRNPNFYLAKLNGIPYLLPFGQMNVEPGHCMKLNSAGAAIWKLLEQPTDLPDLVNKAANLYQTPSGEKKQLEADIRVFLARLDALGMLTDTLPLPKPAAYLRIAGLTLKFCGPEDAVSPSFGPFLVPGAEWQNAEASLDQTIMVSEAKTPETDHSLCLLQSPQLCVYESLTEYILQFPASPCLTGAVMSKSGSFAVFYCQPPYNSAVATALFHGMRISFLLLASKRQMYMLHSASICYHSQAWLFSGPSGMGKSTHTSLWNRYISVPVLNGDLNLLAFSDGNPVIHGVPWCGTSNICCTNTVPLGGIILLGQDPDNRLIPLTEDEKQLLVFQRLVSPLWKEEMVGDALAFIQKLAEKTPILKFVCNTSKEAVMTIKKAVDSLH